MMFWNLFVRPKFRFTEQADVCVTAFESSDETYVRDLFYQHHIGLDIITTSSHPTRELCYKQIYMLGTSVVRSHFEFYAPSMVCSKCGLNPVGSMSKEHLCDFCYMEGEYEKSTGNKWNGE